MPYASWPMAICRSVTRGPRNENSDSYSGAPDQTTIIYLCIVYIRYCASVRLWSEIKFTLLTLLYFTATFYEDYSAPEQAASKS